MSFSGDVKEELLRLPMGKPCCMLSEIAALTQTTGSLGFQGAGRFSLTWRVESAALARRLYTMLKQSQGVSPSVEYVRHTRLGGRQASELTLSGEDATTLLVELGMMVREEDGSTTLKRTTARPVLTRGCCRRAFVRGAFLGAGSMTNPEKAYHFEIVAGDEALKTYLLRCFDKTGIDMHACLRKGQQLVYLKKSESISAILTFMGATGAMMELENTRITRQMIGNINRASNCDDHNFERTQQSSDKQVKAITLLSIHRGLNTLPKALEAAARLRLDNPSATLVELGQMLEPPVGKSGMNHRMERLMVLSEQLEQELTAKETAENEAT